MIPIEAEGFGYLLNRMGKASVKAGKEMATNVMKIHRRATKGVAKLGSVAVCGNPKAVSISTTVKDVKSFTTSVKDYILELSTKYANTTKLCPSAASDQITKEK